MNAAGARARLRSGERLVGTFSNLGSWASAEIVGRAGFDWVVIDLEHGSGGESVLAAQINSVASGGAIAMVRVDSTDRARIGHALDLGADGVLVPQLSCVDEARQVARSCRFGESRGIGRTTRGVRWGLGAIDPLQVDAEVVCGVQIETEGALADVEEIAGIDGIDLLFFGPGDMGRVLGTGADPTEPRVLEAAVRVAEAANGHGKIAGVVVGTVEHAARYEELGFRFLGCASDGALLGQTTRELASSLRRLNA